MTDSEFREHLGKISKVYLDAYDRCIRFYETNEKLFEVGNRVVVVRNSERILRKARIAKRGVIIGFKCLDVLIEFDDGEKAYIIFYDLKKEEKMDNKPQKIDKTLTDVMLIVKDWYNHGKHKCLKDALNSYYIKEYMYDTEKEKIDITLGFISRLWFQYIVKEAVMNDGNLVTYLLLPSQKEIMDSWNCEDTSVEEAMYYRELTLIENIKSNLFDLSEYEEMFEKKGYII